MVKINLELVWLDRIKILTTAKYNDINVEDIDALWDKISLVDKSEPVMCSVRSYLMTVSDARPVKTASSLRISLIAKMGDKIKIVSPTADVHPPITLFLVAAVWVQLCKSLSLGEPLDSIKELHSGTGLLGKKFRICCVLARDAVPPRDRDNIWRAENGNVIDGECFVCECDMCYFEAHIAHVYPASQELGPCPFVGGVRFDPIAHAGMLKPTCQPCNAFCATRNLLDVRDASRTIRDFTSMTSLSHSLQELESRVRKVMSRKDLLRFQQVEALWVPSDWPLPADLSFKSEIKGSIQRFIRDRLKSPSLGLLRELDFLQEILVALITADPPDLTSIELVVRKLWYHHIQALHSPAVAEKAEANRQIFTHTETGEPLAFHVRLQKAFLWAMKESPSKIDL